MVDHTGLENCQRLWELVAIESLALNSVKN